MSTKNRRKNERIPVKMEVVLELPDHDPIAFISKDVSAGGIFLERTHQADVLPFVKVGAKGSIIMRQRTSGGLEIMSTNIEIVRVTPEGAGVKLLSELVFQSRAA